jgi:7-cyano-7-deazaguanine synthase in queuosine biosynthesis
MCGIVGLFVKESVPSVTILDVLFSEASKRGSDAFGIVIIDSKSRSVKKIYRTASSWGSIQQYIRNDMLQNIQDNLSIGDLMLANFRLEPETECRSTNDNLVKTTQPIIKNGIVLVHNGAINRTDYERLSSGVENVSDIDSEAIINAYLKYGKNLENTFESFGGGVSALMYDGDQNQLIVSQTHNPLSHGYFRGVGMFWHSRQEALDEVRKILTKTTGDGCCMWENYYAHPKSTPFRCTKIDLDSGFMGQSIYFEPNYKSHPTWDSSTRGRRKYLVGASSGIDSTTNLAILNMIGADVQAVYVDYGHRGGECEIKALIGICQVLKISPPLVIDQNEYYKTVDNFSMLTDPNKPIKTGGHKSVAAWVTGRNLNILRILADIGESNILQNNYDEVTFCLGFNISEESVYPDNSQMFVDSFMQLAKVGYLTGTRMKFSNVTQNLNKADMMHLLNKLGLYETLIPRTISCDRPKMHNGHPANCSVVRDGVNVPGCGSGWLYSESAANSNLPDIKRYYTIDDPDYNYIVKKRSKTKRSTKSDEELLNALNISDSERSTLQGAINVQIAKGKGHI